ncbi:MAG: helix-turn-helix domain-containing protein [Proteobacteria bacterium]|nr:helix-turn-helix domain-containing protein [Pseudomonadota bacterium]
MLSLQRRVPPPLDRFIDFLWYWEGEPAAHARDIITASRSHGLLISLCADELAWYSGSRYAERNKLRGIALSGPNSAPFAIDAFQPHIMGVHFRPGGAWPFLKPGASTFSDTHVSMADIWGDTAERLQARLIQAPTPDDKFDILLAALVRLAPRDFERHPAVELGLSAFEHAPHRISVAAVAKEAGVSAKKFIRLFNDQVGMTPKVFLRIARFQRVMAQIASVPNVDWWDVVERHGYYDQPHFIRDFKAFTGLPPTAWMKQRGPYVGHIPLLE